MGKKNVFSNVFPGSTKQASLSSDVSWCCTSIPFISSCLNHLLAFWDLELAYAVANGHVEATEFLLKKDVKSTRWMIKAVHGSWRLRCGVMPD